MKSAAFSDKIETAVEHKELTLEGCAIHYFVSGDKANDLLVFLHPAFADHRCFEKQIDFFSGKFRVIAMDLLGHGLSRAGKAKDKIDASLLHIEAIIKTEGYERAHFIGVSMGTLIAQYFALFHPDRVLSMTILGGYDINADNKEIAKAQRAEGLKWMVKAIFSMESFRKYVASVSVLRREEQARFHEMARSFTRKSFLVMSGLGKVLQIREGCKRDYPLLILCGDSDIELSRRMSERWHRSQPGSKFCLISEAGHCANMDNPGAFNETVMAFIEGNS